PPSFTALSIDDSADTVARKATIDSGAITGLAPAVIAYTPSDLSALTIWGGTKGDTFTVANTPTGFSDPVTTLHCGLGADKAIIQATSGALIVDGGAGVDPLVGANTANTWNLTAFGNSVGDVLFAAVENLTGGASTDVFKFITAGVTGMVDGGGGADTLDFSGYSLPVTVNLQTARATATGRFARVEQVIGSPQSDTLVGRNTSNTWTIR